MDNWYFLAEGTRPGEKIVAQRNSGGLILHVAAAFLNPQNSYLYNLYPVSYKGIKSIDKKQTISIYSLKYTRS